MRKQDLLLNLFLTLSLGLLGWKLHNDWRMYAAQNGPQALDVHSVSGVSLPPLSAAPDYTAVARQNPFQAERNDVIEEPAAQAKPTGPPPLIYGSIIMEDTRFALMANEQSPKPERVAEGGMFEGYRLVKVLPESVILESAGGRDEIMLYNALMRLRRQQAKTTVSAASHPSTPTQVNSTASPNSATALPQSEMASQALPNSAAGTKPQSTPALAAPPGKEVVETPFGPVLVEKKKQ